ADLAADGRGGRPPPRGRGPVAERLDRAPPRGGRGRVADEGDRLPRGHGRPREVQAAVPPPRRTGAADRLLGERGQLLPGVPDRGPDPGRPVALPDPQGRLAEDAGGAGGAVAVFVAKPCRSMLPHVFVASPPSIARIRHQTVSCRNPRF